MGMDKEALKAFFRYAVRYSDSYHAESVEQARALKVPETFIEMPCAVFLQKYCWAIYTSAFRASIVAEKRPALARAWFDYDLGSIVTSDSIEPALSVINNKRKAAAFLKGCHQIHDEGYEDFKARALHTGWPIYTELPYIGDILAQYIATITGLQDLAKPDVWVVRIKDGFNADSVDELIDFLQDEFGYSRRVTDLYLWRLCSDAGLETVNRLIRHFRLQAKSNLI